MLLSIVKELQDIITNNDARFAAENILSTHDCGLLREIEI